MKKLNIKITLISIFCIFLISLCSCQNSFSGNNEKERYVTLSGNVKHEMEGGVPSEYCNYLQMNDESRAAFPTLESISVYYRVYAVDKSTSAPLDDVEATVTSSSFSIILPQRVWTIHVEGYSDSGKTNLILAGSKEVDLTGEEIPESITVNALGIQESDSTGYVNLPISVADTSQIPYGEAVWNSGGFNITHGFDFTKTNPAHFTMNIHNTEVLTAIEPGRYDVTFNFYNSKSADKIKLYSFTQKVNVYTNLTTNKWVGKAPYINGGEIKITNAMAVHGTRKEFYVNGLNGDDEEGTGGALTPFITINKALEIINSINDGTSLYEILLSYDYVGFPENIGVDETLGNSLIKIESSTPLNLKISSKDVNYMINANGDGAGNNLRVLYVGKNVTLTLENVTVTGGKITNKNGGGIYVDTDGKLILNSNAVVNNNAINSTDGAVYNGNGIYCAGSIEINAGSLITKNTTPLTVPINGGGVTFNNPNGTFVMNGGIISENEANHGGGLVLYTGQNLEIKDGQFTDNKCYITGGAIWANSTQSIDVKNCVFTKNSARNGGAIFNKGFLNLSDCVFENNSAELSGTKGGNGGAVGIWQGKVKISGENTKFLNNTSDMNGGAIYCSTGVEYGDATLDLSAGYFKGNTIKAASGKGNGIYVSDYKDDSKSFTADIKLSGSVKMENDQIIYLEKTVGAKNQDQKFINLGELTGSPTNQKFNLDLGSYADGTVILKEAVVGESNVNNYFDRFTLADSNFEITNEGKLKDLTIAGVTEDLDNLYDDATVINEIPEAGKTYTVSSVDDLVYLRTVVNTATSGSTCDGVTFKLGNDITLTGTWTSIGTTSAKCFSGTFDGCGYEISGIGGNGLFKYASNAVIKNLTVSGSTSYGYGSGFVGNVDSGTLLIDNCINNVSYSSSNSYFGGFVAYILGGSVTIINSENRADITTSKSTANIGGFVGYVAQNGTPSLIIKNCINKGDVTGTNASGDYVGGFVGNVGKTESVSIINCINIGKIQAGASTYGAITGNRNASITYTYYLTSSCSQICGDGSTPIISDSSAGLLSFDSTGNFAAGEQSLEATNVLDALNNGINEVLNGDGYTYNPWVIGNSGFPEFVAGTPATYPEDTPGDFDRLSVTEVVTLSQISSLASAPSAGDKLKIKGVNDIKKLIEFAQTDSLEDVSFYLEYDIDAQDLDGGSWTPLGTADKPFKGYFDGMGKTIKLNNLPGNESVALIAYAENAKVRNVKVTGTITGADTTKYIAGIVGHSKGSLLVENCTASDGNMTSTGAECVAGIVAYAETQTDDDLIIIRNCCNSLGVQGTVAATTPSMAGVVGHISGNKGKVYVHNCANKGTLASATYLGGILAWSKNNNTWVENCVNTYEIITSESTKGSVIGYVPDTNNGVIKNCFGVYYTDGQSQVYGTAGGVSGDYTSVGSYSVAASKATIRADGTSLVEKLNAWCISNGSLYKQWTEDVSGVPAFTE